MSSSVMIVFIALYLCSSVLSVAATETPPGQSFEANLIGHLKSLRDSRPVLNVSEAVKVKIGYGLTKIMKVDFVDEIMEVVGWLKLEWRHNTSGWSPDQYGGLQSISVDPKQIWTPDVVLINAASNPEPINAARVSVQHTGHFSWMQAYRHRFYWDKDSAGGSEKGGGSYTMKFASWTMDTSRLDLILAQNVVDAAGYIRHPTWELGRTTVSRRLVKYLCCPAGFNAEALFLVQLTRRTSKDDDASRGQNGAMTQFSTLWVVRAFVAAALSSLLGELLVLRAF